MTTFNRQAFRSSQSFDARVHAQATSMQSARVVAPSLVSRNARDPVRAPSVRVSDARGKGSQRPARGEPIVACRPGVGMVTICPPRNARNPMRLMKTAFGPVSRAVSDANRVGASRGRMPSVPVFKPATMFRPKASV